MKDLMIVILLLSAISLSAQVDQNNPIKSDFEKFKQDYNRDFENYKKQYEEALRKMEQDYQDYYNSMVGLKDYYTRNKDTAKAAIVGDVISYEQNIRKASGKPIVVTKNVPVQPDSKVQQPVNKPVQQPVNKPVEQPPARNVEQPVAQPVQQPKPQPVEIAPPANDERVPVIYPLPPAKARITSPFGPRIHPVLNRPINHNGIDFGCQIGTEIYAAGSGKITLSEYNKTFGNYIMIEHDGGFCTVYAHLNQLMVSKGETVNKGQKIAQSGNTGRSTGAHLHYEIRLSGTPIDPKPFLK